MRFYTAVINDKEELLVGFEQGARAYRLSLLARSIFHQLENLCHGGVVKQLCRANL